MRRGLGNGWAKLARSLTALSNQNAPALRWVLVLGVLGAWIWAGYYGWSAQAHANGDDLAPQEIFYRVFGALGAQDYYWAPDDWRLNLSRFAGLFLPALGLLFAFWGQLTRSLAQLASALGAGGHVVIAGGGPPALALAEDCSNHGDVVALVAPSLPPDTALALRRRGVLLVEGDPAMPAALRAARAGKASHVVALADADPVNLRIEAAVRGLAQRRGAAATAVHVGMRAPTLLQEAREMRALEARKAADPKAPPSDPRPFALHELAARKLWAEEAPVVLEVAARHAQPRPHLVVFGYDDTADAVIVRALMTLWSVHFAPPRVTVVTPDASAAELRFSARYPYAQAMEGAGDVRFIAFDWTLHSVTDALLARIGAERGPASAVAVSTGDEAETITLALALLRACNIGPLWPVPIFMKESSASEFSKIYAAGDRTPDKDDAYLQAFGADQSTATRRLIIEGTLDQGAAIAHAMYEAGVKARGEGASAQLEALGHRWETVPETYRSANRAVADHALVKLWDAGWRPAPKPEPGRKGKKAPKGERAPEVDDAMIARLARVEHDRWCAERLFGGWRPPRFGEGRNNELRIHPSLKPWSALTADEQEKDADQVRAGLLMARALHPRGFVRRG